MKPEDLTWKENSKAMFEATIKAAPAFVRPIARKKLLRDLSTRLDAEGAVTEDIFIATLKEVTPAKRIETMLKDLGPLKTK